MTKPSPAPCSARAAAGSGADEEDRRISTSPFSPGTDDIGDVSWVVPTVQLRYSGEHAQPAARHHWSNAMAMATPIAHKGIVCGAKVVAATVLDLLLQPELISETKRYFTEECRPRTSNTSRSSVPDDKPPARSQSGVDGQVPTADAAVLLRRRKYDTYLEQLGVAYPQLERPA